MSSLPIISRYCAQTITRNGLLSRVRKHNLRCEHSRRFSVSRKREVFKVLGIETSCDDTGVAIVDSERNLLGEALHNQNQIHLDNGGILPPIAGYHHRANMESVANQALNAAGLSMSDIDVVAATVKPGLSLSLTVGMKYGCHLSREWKKPFIPIHHMEAHALTARMIDEKVQFPFLVLLISGGHCLLALAENVDSFSLLGKSCDNPPGEVFDKLHRQLKLRNLPELSRLSGGHAVEVMAEKATNPSEFSFEIPSTRAINCDFSFSGLLSNVRRTIEKEEQKYETTPDGVIESAPNLCAAVQFCVAQHLCRRLERAMIFLDRKGMIPRENRSLVVSGGVGANKFISKAIQIVCSAYNYHLSVPPPKLCNDNGVMIAWNGVERYRENKGVLQPNQLDSVEIATKCPLGEDIRELITNENLSKLRYVKLSSLSK